MTTDGRIKKRHRDDRQKKTHPSLVSSLVHEKNALCARNGRRQMTNVLQWGRRLDTAKGTDRSRTVARARCISVYRFARVSIRPHRFVSLTLYDVPIVCWGASGIARFVPVERGQKRSSSVDKRGVCRFGGEKREHFEHKTRGKNRKLNFLPPTPPTHVSYMFPAFVVSARLVPIRMTNQAPPDPGRRSIVEPATLGRMSIPTAFIYSVLARAALFRRAKAAGVVVACSRRVSVKNGVKTCSFRP